MIVSFLHFHHNFIPADYKKDRAHCWDFCEMFDLSSAFRKTHSWLSLWKHLSGSINIYHCKRCMITNLKHTEIQFLLTYTQGKFNQHFHFLLLSSMSMFVYLWSCFFIVWQMCFVILTHSITIAWGYPSIFVRLKISCLQALCGFWNFQFVKQNIDRNQIKSNIIVELVCNFIGLVYAFMNN